MILESVDTAMSEGASLAGACEVVGLSTRTVQRWRQEGGGDDRRRGPTSAPHNKLGEEEDAAVVEIANSPDFAELSPKLNWVKTSGLITPAKWGNLPGGEIFTSPFNSNGRFVVDGVVGDYLCQKYGDIGATPLTIEIKDNRIAKLACKNKELLKEFDAYCHTDENSNRVGEFAIGTNLACTHIIGHILQDEKLPGIHIAFGHPYSEHTGQTWKSTTHIDCVGRHFDIWLDDEQVMAKGKFLL